MALEGEERVVAHHAAAVIGNLDEFFAAAFHLHANAARARVQRVLEQLLYDRGRALDDFSGSDLVSDMLRENVDASHGISHYRRPPASGRDDFGRAIVET